MRLYSLCDDCGDDLTVFPLYLAAAADFVTSIDYPVQNIAALLILPSLIVLDGARSINYLRPASYS